MSLGELYVKLSLRNSDFAKNLTESTKKIDAFGKKMAEVGGKVGALGVAGAAALGGFVAKAAEANKAVDRDLKQVQGAFRALAVEIGKALGPAMNALASAVGKLAGWFRSLSPQTKTLIGNIAGFGSGALVAVGAVSKLVGTITSLAPLVPVIASLGAPFLAIAAGIAGVILLVGALRRVWDQVIPGMKFPIEELGTAIKAFLLGPLGILMVGLKKIGDQMGIKMPDWLDSLGGVGKDVGKDIAETFALGLDTLIGPLLAKFESLMKAPTITVDAPDKSKRKGGSIWDAAEAEYMAQRNKEYAAFSSKFASATASGKTDPATRIASLELKNNADRASEALAQFRASVQAAQHSLAEGFMQRTGPVAGLVQSGMQGAAAGGGPAGAAAAIMADLLTQSAQFVAVIAVITGLVGVVADALGTLLEPLRPLIGAIALIVTALTDALQPVLMMLATFIEPLIPVIVELGLIMKMLAPVFGVLLQMFLLIQNPLLLLSGPALKGLFYVLKGVAAVALGFAWGIGKIWNGVLSVIQWVLKLIDKIPGVNMNSAIRKLERSKMDTGKMEQQFDELWHLREDEAHAIAESTAQTLANADATKQATAAIVGLTNMPSWYKVEGRRFGADSGGVRPLLPKMEEANALLDDIAGEMKRLNKTATQLIGEEIQRQKGKKGINPLLDAVATITGNGSTSVSSAALSEAGDDVRKKAALAGFAEGGIVTRPTLGVFGEAGPEAIVPLRGNRHGLGGGGDVYITVVSHDAAETYRKLKQLMARDNFRMRGTPVGA